MERLIALLNWYAQIVKPCALKLLTGCHHTGWLRNLQDRGRPSNYQNYSALLFIMAAHYLVLWKYVSNDQYTYWDGNIKKRTLKLISSLIHTFKQIEMQVSDAAGAFFDILRSVDLPQHDILSLFDMLRPVDLPQ